jgi:hypothetical protein
MLVTLLADLALACGGLACNPPPPGAPTIPVVQAREQVLFAVDPLTNTTEMHVQINTSGTVPDFSWIIPLPAAPEILPSTPRLFNRLSPVTRPSYTFEQRDDGTCTDRQWNGGNGGNGGGGFGGGGGGLGGLFDSGAGVQVVAESVVGVYDTVTLQASDADILLTWLTEQGYSVPPGMAGVLAPYISQGQYFVALKLHDPEAIGALPPLAFRLPGTRPTIPLQLTSVAVAPELPIEVYFLAEHRFVPENYLHVQINPTWLDYWRSDTPYEDALPAAIREAGGRAFVTDMSLPTDNLGALMYAGDRRVLEPLRRTEDPATYLQMLRILNLFDFSAPLYAVLRQHFPIPAGAVAAGETEEAFWWDTAWGVSRFSADLPPIDPVAVTADIDAQVIAPIRHAQALIDASPQLTRLSTSMTALDMTVDPVFVQNPDMPNVRRERTVWQAHWCEGTASEEVPSRLYASGYVIDTPPEEEIGDFSTWLREQAPAAWVVEITGASGLPTLLADNRPQPTAAPEPEPEAPIGPSPFPEAPVEDAPGAASEGCGCDQGVGGPWWSLAALGAVAARRRGARSRG